MTFFVLTLLVLPLKKEHPLSNSKRRDGPGSRSGTALYFLLFVQSCTKCVPTYFFPDSNSGLFDSDLVVQVAS